MIISLLPANGGYILNMECFDRVGVPFSNGTLSLLVYYLKFRERRVFWKLSEWISFKDLVLLIILSNFKPLMQCNI